MKEKSDYKYTSMLYVEPTDSELIEKEQMLLYKSSEAVPTYHFACDDVQTLLKFIEGPGIIQFVPREWVETLESAGFKVKNHYKDFWSEDLSKSGPYKLIDKMYVTDLVEIAKLTFNDPDYDNKWFESWYDHKAQNMSRTNILGAFVDDKLVGYACVGLYGPHPTLWIRAVAVHPDFQKQGIGRALMIGAISYGRYRGARKMFLATDITNDVAISLYEDLGFKCNDDEEIVMKRE